MKYSHLKFSTKMNCITGMVLLLVICLPMGGEARIRVSPAVIQIHTGFCTIPPNFNGKKEVRHFIRIAEKVSLKEIERRIDSVVACISDSIIRKDCSKGECGKVPTIPDGYSKYVYSIVRSCGVSKVHNHIHFVVNADCTIIALWTYESNIHREGLVPTGNFSKKVLRSVFKNIANTYYLGKQIVVNKIVAAF